MLRQYALRSVAVVTILAFAMHCSHFADAAYAISLNNPAKAGTIYGPGATIQYAGTATWGQNDPSVYRVSVNFVLTNKANWDPNTQLGIGDSEEANIPTYDATSLKYQSASYR